MGKPSGNGWGLGVSEGSKKPELARRNGFGAQLARNYDIVTLGIAAAAIILFVGTGGSVVPRLVAAWRGAAQAPDVLMTNAFLLNIAVILFGWNRYKALNAELVDRRRSESEARRLADIDPLTGCLNRRSINPAIYNLVRGAHAEGRAVATILVDLDNFKQVNDLHGHHVGDRVLNAASDRLADVLPVGALLARLGGDEFAAALTYDPSDRDMPECLALRLIEKVAEPIELEVGQVEITMSVGVVSSQVLKSVASKEETAVQLLRKGDIAMYQAKKLGKNRMVWFEPEMEHELRFRNDLESGIRHGLANREFVPYYEQQIDLETGDLVGFEMLARWESPALGVVGPDIFIPIAEEIGLIGDLSEQLMAQAFEDAKLWDPKLTVSVNISPIQLRDPWFSQKLLKMLVQHNFPPSRLDIEITESCLHENIGLVRSMITSLQNQGVGVSLDDFGTGYSSLSQLRTLPFDRLKIDRSFIRDLDGDIAESKLVDAIVSMGDGLSMPITAEGIENAKILETLRSMGQLKGQGYHYGKPEPAHLVLQRLATKGLLATDHDKPAKDRPSKRIRSQAF